MDTLNNRLAKLRKLSNLTQTDVAEKLNIKCSTFSQMERNGVVSAERFFQLAKIYGVTPCKIFYGEEPCKPKDGLRQDPPPLPPRPVFVVTKKEENLIKMIRNFSKTDYNRVMQLVETIYKEDKK